MLNNLIFGIVSFLLPVVNTVQAQGLAEIEIRRIFELEKKILNNSYDTVILTKTLPRSSQKGFRPISDWTSGFYPGCLWLTYDYTKDPAILQKAKLATAMVEDNKYFTTDHDIGFMVYCSFGQGYRLTKDPKYREVILEASRTAMTRYDHTVQSFMSWDPNKQRDWKFPVIIDNMMNLEMLLEAHRWTENTTFYQAAIKHANTTMKNQYRANYSCAHVVDYDPITGAMRKMDWNNGNNDPKTASWSRGQSWGLYGFTLMYRYTKQKEYLEQAEKIASYILNHPNMPDDMVPYWDYQAPKLPTARDASAAAILASGLLELSTFETAGAKTYFKSAERILKSLSSPSYMNNDGKTTFLLKHATGNYVQKSELDGGLIYADYYFLEALLRYQHIKYRDN